MKLEKEVKIYNAYNYAYGNPLSSLLFEEQFTLDELDVIKKSKAQKIKLILEIQEPILDEEERKYLIDVIRPFRDEIEYIEKVNFTDEYEYLAFYMKNQPAFTLANFKEGTMYKGMELDKQYTLEELGL